ncbi:MAG: hypothetical protein NXH75_16235, partial [Halobacteriovoraceae bacterium]|nr:hypothetical protein [Halobacteriovoraceae bacterium]
MKQVGILLIFPFLFSSFCLAEATTFGGTVQISVGGAGPVDTEPVVTTSPERGEFSGRQFVLGTMNLDGYLNPFGGSVPKLSSYKDGQIRIGELIDGKPGSGSEVYKVYLYGRHNDRNLHPSAKTGPKVGEYLMTRKQIEALMGGSTLDRSAEELKNLNNRYTQAQDCSPMLGYASEADYRSDVARSLQRSPQTDVPEENFTPGPRSSDSRPDSPGYSAPPGNAPFATGTSRSVGDGT